MLRKTIAAAAAAACCLAPTSSLLAQDYRPSGFDAPRGAAATFNLRVPLGGRAQASRPTLGLTMGYGRAIGGSAADDSPSVRQLRLADFRFGRDGLDRAELASFDLADPDGDRRLSLSQGRHKNMLWIVLTVAAGVMACVVVCDGDDSRNEDSDDDEDDTIGDN